MRTDDEGVSFDNVEVSRETEKALLCVIEGEEHWIPKSQILDASEVYSKDTSGGLLVVSKWIADEKGL